MLERIKQNKLKVLEVMQVSGKIFIFVHGCACFVHIQRHWRWPTTENTYLPHLEWMKMSHTANTKRRCNVESTSLIQTLLSRCVFVHPANRQCRNDVASTSLQRLYYYFVCCSDVLYPANTQRSSRSDVAETYTIS